MYILSPSFVKTKRAETYALSKKKGKPPTKGNKEQSKPWLKLADLPLLCVKNTRNTLSIPAFLCLD